MCPIPLVELLHAGGIVVSMKMIQLLFVIQTFLFSELAFLIVPQREHEGAWF